MAMETAHRKHATLSNNTVMYSTVRFKVIKFVQNPHYKHPLACACIMNLRSKADTQTNIQVYAISHKYYIAMWGIWLIIARIGIMQSLFGTAVCNCQFNK